jgi:hypothetical protein
VSPISANAVILSDVVGGSSLLRTISPYTSVTLTRLDGFGSVTVDGAQKENGRGTGPAFTMLTPILIMKMSENRDRNILVAAERCLDRFELIVDESTVEKSRAKCSKMTLMMMM